MTAERTAITWPRLQWITMAVESIGFLMSQLQTTQSQFLSEDSIYKDCSIELPDLEETQIIDNEDNQIRLFSLMLNTDCYFLFREKFHYSCKQKQAKLWPRNDPICSSETMDIENSQKLCGRLHQQEEQWGRPLCKALVLQTCQRKEYCSAWQWKQYFCVTGWIPFAAPYW